MSGYCHHTVMSSIRLSSTKSKQNILQQKCLNKQIVSAPQGTRFYNFQHRPYPSNSQPAKSGNCTYLYFALLIMWPFCLHSHETRSVSVSTVTNVTFGIGIWLATGISQQQLGFLFLFSLQIFFTFKVTALVPPKYAPAWKGKHVFNILRASSD